MKLKPKHDILLFVIIMILFYENIYIIINVTLGAVWMCVDLCGRAMPRWNCLDPQMSKSWNKIGSRAPRARSAQKCVFLLHKAALNGSCKAFFFANMNCRLSQKLTFQK